MASAAELWTGGFPCQDLSVAGKRRGMGAGTRSGLAFAFLDLVGRHRPRFVLLENVPGLLSSHAGRDFGTLLAALVELGYGVGYRVLDARYFGVPQRRRRVFILGDSLADVLEPSAPPRFYLSARAATGILRRASKRGRELPTELDQALTSLARSSAPPASDTTRTSTPSLGLDSHRYRCCGNGVVADVAEWIGLRLAAIEQGTQAPAAEPRTAAPSDVPRGTPP
jgi:DNA (cytosine-5)-methyltransferase 1